MTWDATDILNWRRWNDNVTLSGQPTEAQFADLAAKGVRHVINLGPYSNDGALQDEPGCLAALGLGYTYIPVDFDAPTDADYSTFLIAYNTNRAAPLHVHCIYNARVSAFMYRLAKEGRDGQLEMAADLMDGIWRPGGVWARFIGDTSRVEAPNMFAGYEY